MSYNIYLGNNIVDNIYLGNTEITEADLLGSKLNPAEYVAYKLAVLSDSGVIKSESNTVNYFKWLLNNNLLDSTKFLFYSLAGYKARSTQYLSIIYSLDSTPNNATQTTEASQPFIAGLYNSDNKLSILNPNADTRYIGHSDVVYASDAAWSYTCIFNYNGSNATTYVVLSSYNSDVGANQIALKRSGTNQIAFFNASTGYNLYATSVIIGKSNILHFVADGAGNLKLYLNGVQVYSGSVVTSIKFKNIISPVSSSASTSRFYGRYFANRLQDGAMTPQQVADEYIYLRSVYDVIEHKSISGYNVATESLDIVSSLNATLIANVTDNTAWSAGTSAWCYHTYAVGLVGKMYNKAARDVIISNPPYGYHVSTEAELTKLSLLGGNALKVSGTDHWSTAGGTNITGFNAIGGASRNADGKFNTWNETVSFWCADSDKVLKLHHDSDTAEIVSANAAEGHYIRLVKNQSLGLTSGDSTVAAYLGQNAIDAYVLSAPEISNYNVVSTIAYPGDTIAQQKSKFLNLTNKYGYDYYVVQIGLNDLDVASTSIAALQDYIDTINYYKNPDAKIYIATMTPCRANRGEAKYAVWLLINEAIRGEGLTPITGVNGRISSHTTALSDGNDNLDADYEIVGTVDHIHENNEAREIIAAAWRDVIDIDGIII